MTRWQRRFAVLVAIAWIAAAAAMTRYAMQAKIPAAKLDHVDAEVAGAIAFHQQWMNLASGEDWRSLGKLYLAYGCLPEAEICCRHAADLAPESKDVLYLWAVVLDRFGRLDEAEQKLAKAIELGAGESAAWVRMGRIKLRQEAPQEAERAFRKALDLDHDAVMAAIGLARIMLQAERLEEVSPVLTPFLESRPLEHAPCQLLSLAESARGQRQAAAQHLLAADWRPDVSRFEDPQADVNRWAAMFGALRLATESRAAAAAGKKEAAAMLIQQALQLGWDDAFAVQAAATFVEIKQPQEALDLLRGLVVNAGKSEFTSWLEGDAYAALDKLGPAQDAWQESVKLFGNEGAHRRLAELFSRQNPDIGRRHLAWSLYYAALGRYQAGDPDKTEELLRKSLELQPEQAMAWYFLGETKRYQGDVDAAREAYRRALEFEPEHGRAQDALAELDSAAQPSAAQNSAAKSGENDEATEN